MLKLTSIVLLSLLLNSNCSQGTKPAQSVPMPNATATAESNTAPQGNMPSIKVVDLDNKVVDLKTLSSNGRVTIISFWATWCGPCKMELQSYNKEFEKWKKEYNADFYAVSVDEEKTTDNLKSFSRAMGWTFNVLLDNKMEASKSFQISSIPFLIVIDKKGNVAHKQVGFSQTAEAELEAKLKSLK
jgi:cytochrome c biogenesis protein CcmG/thiol:disulfide interchange protein DsbE